MFLFLPGILLHCYEVSDSYFIHIEGMLSYLQWRIPLRRSCPANREAIVGPHCRAIPLCMSDPRPIVITQSPSINHPGLRTADVADFQFDKRFIRLNFRIRGRLYSHRSFGSDLAQKSPDSTKGERTNKQNKAIYEFVLCS